MNIVFFGAGAVGSVLGGLLARQKHDVLLVCKKRHADAIDANGGLRLRSATVDDLVKLRASSTLSADDISEQTGVLITTKSYDTETSIEALVSVVPKDVPVVCLQNGISNEEKVAERFENVYGGVCRMTCSMIQAGQASFRRVGRVIIGKYPKGGDAFAKKLAAAFEEAGCEASVSRNIMSDKWLKLAVNTMSAYHAIIDPRDHDSNEFSGLKVGILKETQQVLKAHKIRPKSYDGKDMTIDEMIADLRKPKARRQMSGVKIRNATWQNLYLKRDRLESEYLHGPIISFGDTYDIPVPYNKTALELVQKSHREELGPEAFRLADVLREIEEKGQQ